MMYQRNYGGEENDDDNKYIDAEVSEILEITKSDNEYDMKPLQVVNYLWKRVGQMEFESNELADDDDARREKRCNVSTEYTHKRSKRVKENRSGRAHV